MSQPFYHLRPNKYVDRCLFIHMLEQLNTSIDLKSHRYIGFGSYLFDDFKLVHNRLNISSMISLESDVNLYKRAQFNLAFKCIKIINQSSTDFISNGDWGDESTIIWLDYTDPKELGKQFNDIATLTKIVETNDIIRVTLNANSSSLGKIEIKDATELWDYRLNKLKERIGDYIPVGTSISEMSTEKYPLLLLKCLKKMLENSFVESKYEKRFLMPLFSTIYEDGQTMLTFTAIVLDDHSKEREITHLYQDIPYINLKWDEPVRIHIPELTVKEMLEMNKLLPDPNAQKQLSQKFDYILEDEINSYISFYKFYPSFQSINF